MKAMILAAGMGTRVNPISTTIPKPLIPLVNRPVLDLLVEYLVRQGVSEIAINTSYLSDRIEQVCQHGQQYGAEILYSYEGEKRGNHLIPGALGSAGGMQKIQTTHGYFDGTFVVMCGDAYLDLDLNEVLKAHHRNRALATVVLKDVSPEACGKYGVVNCDAQGRVQTFQEKPAPGEALSNTINTGIYLFEPEIFDYIPLHGEYDIGSQLLPDLVSKGLDFYGYKPEFNWLDMGSIEDIWQANMSLLNGEMESFDLRGSRKFFSLHTGPGVVIDPHNSVIRGTVSIGSGTIVEPGATIIGPTVIGANCIIKAGTVIREAVIGDHYRIEGDCSLNREIVLAGHRIALNGDSVSLSACEGQISDARSRPTAIQTFEDSSTVNELPRLQVEAFAH